MSRRGWAAAAAVVVVVFMGVVAWWYLDTPRRVAASSVRAYDVKLSQAVRTLNPELLGTVASAEEKQRVASYVTLLWGRGMALDATLESLDVTSAERSEDGSITADVTEVWTYQDLESESGRRLGAPRRETMRLRYTLVRREQIWVVGRSELLDSQGKAGPRQ